MRSFIAVAFAFVIGFANINTAKAVDVSTSVVVGVVVAHYAGAAAGVAVSSLLAGTATVLHSKEAVAKAALNDAQDFYLTGELSVALENSINSIQELDSSISDSEAVDMIVASIAE